MTFTLALAGFGRWGQILLLYLDKQFKVECIFGRSIQKQGRFTNDLTDVYLSNVDAVVVATPVDTHFDIVRKVLSAGKHVFCEKPLALTPQEAGELITLANSRKLHLVTDYTYTFSKRLLRAQKSQPHTMLMRLERNIGSRKSDVYWQLASHMIAALGLFTDLSQLEFNRRDCIPKESAVITFNGLVDGTISVDTNAVEKKTEIVLYTDDGVLRFNDLLQDDNLGYAVSYFKDVLDGEIDNSDNLKRAYSVTKVLWGLGVR